MLPFSTRKKITCLTILVSSLVLCGNLQGFSVIDKVADSGVVWGDTIVYIEKEVFAKFAPNADSAEIIIDRGSAWVV